MVVRHCVLLLLMLTACSDTVPGQPIGAQSGGATSNAIPSDAAAVATPQTFRGVALPPPVVAASDRAPPSAWLVVGATAVPGVALAAAGRGPLPADAAARLAVVALPPGAAPVVVVNSAVVPQFQALLGPWNEPQAPLDAAQLRELDAARQPETDVTAFSLAPIGEGGELLLQAVVTYAVGPAGPADDPATSETRYFWRLSSAP